MDIPERILHYLHDSDNVDSVKLADEWQEDHQKVVGAIKSLEALEMVIATTSKSTKWDLTDEGKQVAENGSHEAVLYYSVPSEGAAQTELMKV